MRSKKLAAIMATILLILVGIAVRVVPASAQDEEPLAVTTVQIATPAYKANEPLYWQRSTGESSLVGDFDVYYQYGPLVFTWQPDLYEQIDFAHTSYQVFLRQYFPWEWPFYDPLDFDQGFILGEEYQDVRVAHHWASNPNHTAFTFAMLYNEVIQPEDEWVCDFCPTRIIVQPEILDHYLNTNKNMWEYKYTPIPNALQQWSEIFIVGGD